jgi:hypothetical protein
MQNVAAPLFGNAAFVWHQEVRARILFWHSQVSGECVQRDPIGVVLVSAFWAPDLVLDKQQRVGSNHKQIRLLVGASPIWPRQFAAHLDPLTAGWVIQIALKGFEPERAGERTERGHGRPVFSSRIEDPPEVTVVGRLITASAR